MWPSFRFDRSNTGVSPFVLANSNHVNNKQDSVYVGGLIWGTPVANSTTLFVGSTNKRVYAIDIKTHRIIYNYRIKNRADSLIDSASSLSPDGKQLVIPGGDGFLHALDANTGKLQWLFDASKVNGASEDTHKSGVIVNSFEGNVKHSSDGSRIYAGNDNSHFYCINAKDGSLIWSYKTDMMIWTVAAFTQDDKYVAFGSLDGKLYICDALTGELADSYDTKGEIKASPIITGNNDIYVCNSNGTILRLIFTPATKSLKLAWKQTLNAEIYASPAIKNNIIIAATMDGQIAGYNAQSGALLWLRSIIVYTTSSPIITQDNTIILGNSKGRLIALDLESGSVKGVLALSLSSKNINSSPIQLADGRIIAGSYDGKVYFVPPPILLNAKDTMSPLPFTRTPTLIEVSEPSSYIKSYRLVVYDDNRNLVQNAAISKYHTDNQDLPYTVTLSPDGKFMNFIPNNTVSQDAHIRVTGTYFLQTNSWITDRLVFSDAGNFEANIIFTPPHTQHHGASYNDWLQFDIHKMAVSQPIILDTYIPAAMDGQGFVGHINVQDPNDVKAIFIPAIPDEEEPFEVLREPAKTLYLKGTLKNDILVLESKTSFTFSAMGGTITFTTFKIFGQLTPKGFANISYYAKASCLKIKGNGEKYEFSTDIINQLCDKRLDTHIIGTAEARLRKSAKSHSFIRADKWLVTHYDPIQDKIHSFIENNPDNLTAACSPIVTFIDDTRIEEKPGECKKVSHNNSKPPLFSTDGFFVENVFGPFIKFACQTGLHPNVVTISSIITTTIMMYIYKTQNSYLTLVPIFMLYKWFADAIDGPIARTCKRTSTLGGYLDMLADYIFTSALYVIFVPVVFKKRKVSYVQLWIEGLFFAAIPWAIIAITSGPQALSAHNDFKNRDTLFNTTVWFLTENTFLMIMGVIIAYIMLCTS